MTRLLFVLAAACTPQTGLKIHGDTGLSGEHGNIGGDSAGAGDSAEAPDADGDGYLSGADDCDDADGSVHPGASESCNARDDDCDGEVDEEAGAPWFLDADGDGYGDDSSVVIACAAPDGYRAASGDCDDGNIDFHPGATEVCTDPNDYNCDGAVGWADGDADGWAACEECDDGNRAVHPDAVEVCNALDDDCDTLTDDADDDLDASSTTTFYVDGDADTYGSDVTVPACALPVGAAARSGDCDDAVSTIHPAATEVCDATDNDCDGDVDDADAGVDLSTAPSWYADADLDGHGDAADAVVQCDAPADRVASDDDCDDDAVDVHPDAPEICNAIDDDCDGDIDDADADVDLTTGTNVYADDDADGYGDAADSLIACAAPAGYVLNATDCADGSVAVNPGATEVCNSLDDDCDGLTDDADPGLDASTGATFYGDADADGYGDAAAATMSCLVAPGTVANADDCDDEALAVNPAATEVCNGVDDDCEGTADGADAVDATVWYLDADLDGAGDSTAVETACDAPDGYVATGGDCDDTDAEHVPGATWYADDDADGFGDASAAVTQCDPPRGYVSDATDCNDGSDDAYPGATESCDSIDNDCDASTDEVGATGCTTYYYDYDADGYGSSSVSGQCSCSTSGYYTAGVATDCYDSNASANPAASSYSYYNRGDGSYDFNCDGASTQYSTAVYTCSTSWTGWSCSGYTSGWSGTAAACGAAGTWKSGCSASWWSCSASSSASAVQPCI